MNRSRSFRMRGIAAVRIVVTMPRQSRERRPAIPQFFHQSGIDPRKEGGIWKVAEFDDRSRLSIVDYRFAGEMEGTRQLVEWMEIDEAKFSLAYHPVLPIFQSCVPAMPELHAELLIRPEMD